MQPVRKVFRAGLLTLVNILEMRNRNQCRTPRSGSDALFCWGMDGDYCRLLHNRKFDGRPQKYNDSNHL